MAPRIAIPMPHSFDPEYAERAIPQYEHAVRLAGGEPVRISLHQAPAEARKIIEGCDGVLLPGSKADVDPAKFNAAQAPSTAAADPPRDTIDGLLLENAYRLRKPVLGICYGLQSLNVYCAGALVQHIPDFLPEETRAKVNHEMGKAVAVAHTVEIEANSNLARIVSASRERSSGAKALQEEGPPLGGQDTHPKTVLAVNSSHHQSAEKIGDGLRAVARCQDDGIIEALEGTSPDHFVLAVQWHPERSVEEDAASRAIFSAFIDAARQRRDAAVDRTTT